MRIGLTATFCFAVTTGMGCSVADSPEGQVSLASTSNVYTSVAAGEFHTLALRSDGVIFAVGENSSGQLGNGTTTPTLAGPPTLVSGLAQVTALAAGCHHSMALTSNGQVWAWGDNSRGQLGTPTKLQIMKTPVQVSGLPAVKAIAAGCFHSLALDTAGGLWTWGSNSHGQLGTGTSSDSLTPVKLVGFQASAIDGGDDFSLALLPDGTVRAWGDNTKGQLATGSTIPISSNFPVLTQLGGISSLAAGARHGLAVKANGTVVAWGDNSLCALGIGTSTPGFSAIPLVVNGVSLPGPAISAGRFFSVSASDDEFGPPNPGAYVYAWGNNVSGQLGDGTTTQRCQPTLGGRYPGFPDNGSVFIPRGHQGPLSAGGSHTVAIDFNGKVVAWGRNNSGQLGTGSITDSVWATQTLF